MISRVSHDRNDESLDAKARWFQSLPLEDRMNLLCEFTDMVLENNPKIAEVGRAKSIPGRILVLELPPQHSD